MIPASVLEAARNAVGQVKTWDGETFALNHTREELDEVATAAIRAYLNSAKDEGFIPTPEQYYPWNPPLPEAPHAD